MTTGTIIHWDYRDQPDWDAINFALQAFETPYIFVVDSGSDEFAVVVMGGRADKNDAQRYFDEHKFDEPA